MIPPSTINELMAKSDTEVDAEQIHEEQLQTKYTMDKIGQAIIEDPFQFDVVRRQLTRKLPQLTAPVHDELDLGFKQYWGTDTQNWNAVNVFPTALKIVTRAANRVFAGPELCSCPQDWQTFG